MSADKMEIEKFNGQNFSFWKMQFEDLLYTKELNEALDKPADDMTTAEWNQIDRKALAKLRLSLTPKVAFNVKQETTTKGALETLKRLYEKDSASNMIHLMKKLFRMTMSDLTSVADHLNEFNKIVDQLRDVEITFTDKILAGLFLSSLPDSWDNLVTTVGATTKELMFDDVVGTILSEEMRRISKSTGSTSGAILAVDHGRQWDRGDRSRSKSRKPRGRSKSKGRTSRKIKGNC